MLPGLQGIVIAFILWSMGEKEGEESERGGGSRKGEERRKET